MRLIAEITFKDGCPSDKAALNALRSHSEQSAGSRDLHVYSVVDSEIDAPECAGVVIHVGEGSRADELGAANRTVTSYYRAGHRLRLQIYRLDAREIDAPPCSEERKLIAANVRQFASPASVESVEWMDAPESIDSAP